MQNGRGSSSFLFCFDLCAPFPLRKLKKKTHLWRLTPCRSVFVVVVAVVVDQIKRYKPRKGRHQLTIFKQHKKKTWTTVWCRSTHVLLRKWFESTRWFYFLFLFLFFFYYFFSLLPSVKRPNRIDDADRVERVAQRRRRRKAPTTRPTVRFCFFLPSFSLFFHFRLQTFSLFTVER